MAIKLQFNRYQAIISERMMSLSNSRLALIIGRRYALRHGNISAIESPSKATTLRLT
jgi:hypothetical protein